MEFLPFLDLIAFTKSASVPLAEIGSAILRLILTDTKLCASLSASLPRKLNFAGRHIQEKESKEEEGVAKDAENHQVVIDAFNGLRLMPPKLKPEIVTALSWETVLRSLLSVLAPVQELIAHQSLLANSSYSSSLNKELGELLEEKINKTAVAVHWRPLLHMDVQTTFSTSASMSSTSYILSLLRAMNALEKTDFYALSGADKVTILRLLCRAAYDTNVVRSLLERHAEERSKYLSSSSSFSSSFWEGAGPACNALRRSKDLSAARREEVILACRKVNEQKATAAGNKGAKKASSGKKGGKDPFAPSPSQLMKALGRAAVLDGLGISLVLPSVPAYLVRNDEEDQDEIPFELLDAGQRAQYRQLKAKQAKNSTSKALLSRDAVEEAKALLQDVISKFFSSSSTIVATENNDTERDKMLRAAVKAGTKAGHRGVTSEGKTFCTELMAEALMLLDTTDARAKMAAEARERERALEESILRAEVLGKDACGRRYWCFKGDEHSLFVETPEQLKDTGMLLTPLQHETLKENDGEDEEDEDKKMLRSVLSPLPSQMCGRWRLFQRSEDLWAIVDSLRPAYEEEVALKTALQTRMHCLQQRPHTFLPEGHEWIGRHVRRDFGKGKSKRTVVGRVSGWLPAEGEDAALWHVIHVDGDEEDLEEEEVIEGLLSEEEELALEAKGEVPLEKDTMDTTMQEVEGDELENIPLLVSSYTNTSRGYSGYRESQLALRGFQSELVQLYGLLAAGLKAHDSAFSKEERRAWEQNVRSANSVSELRDLLLGLEVHVKAVQGAPDVEDAEEADQERAERKANMLREGWIFMEEGAMEKENEKEGAMGEHKGSMEVSSYLGRRCRRLYPSGLSDGVIEAYLPAEGEDPSLWFASNHSATLYFGVKDGMMFAGICCTMTAMRRTSTRMRY